MVFLLMFFIPAYFALAQYLCTAMALGSLPETAVVTVFARLTATLLIPITARAILLLLCYSVTVGCAFVAAALHATSVKHKLNVMVTPIYITSMIPIYPLLIL